MQPPLRAVARTRIGAKNVKNFKFNKGTGQGAFKNCQGAYAT